MKKLLFVLCTFILLSGCATNNYDAYAKGQTDIAVAKANAEAARYKAMSDIGISGDQQTKQLMTFALALGQGNNQQQQSTLQAPQMSEALQWAQILVPSMTQVIGIGANLRMNTVQSNNAASIAVSTNNTFASIAGKIQAPAANITTTTDSHNTATNTLSGTGVLGTGTYTTTDTHATTDNHTTTTNPSTTSPAGKVCSVDSTGTLTCI